MAKGRYSYFKIVGIVSLITVLLLLSFIFSLRRPKEIEITKESKILKPKKDIKADSILVKFKAGTKSKTKENIFKEEKVEETKKIRKLATYEVKPEKEDISKTIKELEANNAVEYAEPNYKVSALAASLRTPNDPLFNSQYGLRKISAPAGWDKETGSSNAVKIAILDTGVDLGHPDLAGKIVSGYDFINNDSSPQDDNGHGTHVAGIAAAITNNAVGVSGTSWGANIMPVKVLNRKGSGSYQSVSNGIIFAVDTGARVINLSLGGYTFSRTLQNATDYAYSRGAVVAAAAGNAGNRSVLYPAGNRNVLGVAATDSNDRRASFSNYNGTVDVSAPGVSVLSTYIGLRYAYGSGTSMATPFTSGLAALIFSQNPGWSAGQVNSSIMLQSDDLGAAGRDDFYGYGRINVNASLNKRPSISRFSLRNNSFLRGRKVLSVSATDGTGIINVAFLFDGRTFANDSSPPYTAVINTRSYSNKRHTFSIRVTNAINRTTSLSRIAYIDNYRPRTFAKRSSARRRGRRRIARVRVYWKVRDPATRNRAIV
ncbi:MAG: peptidase S8, partial [Actinobacteria bacterium]